ncbi:hypothetical protein BV20DRAFT_977605 [Pilatotrama ljubarskyi]|nr:hypothetical protein BV20DRAFT_977605 [Pilatotrama ljubarskyi]
MRLVHLSPSANGPAVSAGISSIEKRDEAWRFCAATIERHDETLEKWNAELGMLLVFAGLFSTALTAFKVQSYLLLHPDNTDTIVLALSRISTHHECFSVNHDEMILGIFEWQAREKLDIDGRHGELEQPIPLIRYEMVSDKTILTSTIVPFLSGMDALSGRMSVQYVNLLLTITTKLKRADWATWRPTMTFALVVLSLIVKEPTARRSAEDPLHDAPRETFENMLRYIHHARVDQERSITLGKTVLHDVEATFPQAHLYNRVEALLDLDNFVSVTGYFTGIERVVLYLLHHRNQLEERLLTVAERVVWMLLDFRSFL